ncbi:hypothetical protein [Hansschlegelia zhihuaiae]|uniref:Uncharacterized protein n=1 Tax=Hansschlegelia zhihuaiae TaxID=405005 RepID=A0A4Q0M419_9HYPH|nr:hypothetical protein [Hansschlegelia zhihuaiae]RXF67677.1 hypothetical protein EK403_20960 [Hansschlegelia zhihuaiae]
MRPDERYAVVIDGVVDNVVLWDGEADWSPDGGDAVRCGDEVEIGWTYEGGAFRAPPRPDAPKRGSRKKAAP